MASMPHPDALKIIVRQCYQLSLKNNLHFKQSLKNVLCSCAIVIELLLPIIPNHNVFYIPTRGPDFRKTKYGTIL